MKSIELGSDFVEEGIEINSEVLDFMRLKYASMLLSGVQESDKKMLLDNNFFTEEDGLRLGRLSTKFANNGITYSIFFNIVSKNNPELIRDIEKETISKYNSIIRKFNKFNEN